MFQHSIPRVLACVGIGLGIAALAQGAEGDVRLRELLLDKGVLTTAESRELDAEPTAPAFPTVKIGGRILVDAGVYDSDDADFKDSTEVRQARIFLKGLVAEDWRYKAQYEFTDSGSESIRDLYLAYTGLGAATVLRIGQFTEYGSIEDIMSAKYRTFMERSLPVQAFGPATRRIGLGLETHGEAWQFGTGVFGESAGADEEEKDGAGVSARFSFAPRHEPGRVLHAGLSGAYRTPRGDDVVRFRARPEAHVDDSRLVDTGPISNVNSRVSGGLEAACVFGPFSLQGEYLGVHVDREDDPSELYDGFYVQASWVLTGESRPYDPRSGLFVRLKPKRPLGKGGPGAVELTARFSTLDLDDNLRGGSEDNVTVGLNWTVNDYTRFLLNVVHAAATRDGVDVDVDIAQVRAQLDF